IADSHEWFSRALETVLVPGGYRVVKAYTARGALQQVEESEPDAVILAVDLPGGEGLNLCRLLRADARVTPSTPIILTQPRPGAAPRRSHAWHSPWRRMPGRPRSGSPGCCATPPERRTRWAGSDPASSR